MRSIRSFFIFSSILVMCSSVFAQEPVNEEELLEHQGPVQFISNNAIPSVIDSRQSIWEIGAGLGRQVNNGSARAGQSGRYFVIHCVSSEQTDRFDADIFGLGPNVGVDHIRNLRLIIQGYLETAYQYSTRDAALLAEYITIYNAVFRQNLDYFTQNYNTIVTENLTADKTGLPLRYDEWAGNTLIVIPLGNAEPGSLSAVNTTPLTDPQVVEEQRQDDDKAIDTRQDMVDLKEREAAEAEQKAVDQQTAADTEQAAIDQERQELEEQKQAAAQQQEQPPSAQEPPADAQTPTEQQPPPSAEQIAQREEELEARQEAVDQQREEAQQNQELAEQKTAEAQEEREGIAQDQQELITNGAPSQPDIVLGTALNSAVSPLGRIVNLDTATGNQVQTSEDSTLNMRTVTIVDDAIIALSAPSGTSYRLVKLSVDTLDTIATGEDAISINSLLWTNGNDFYAIVAENLTTFYIARFDSNLQQQAVSTVSVHPFASVVFYQDKLLSSRANGDVLFLNPQDLTEIPVPAQQ